MENVKIKEFAAISYGYGDGYGDGYGYGYGSGDGSGYGSGDGYGIKEHCGRTVYVIDDVLTLITSVLGGVAKGHILNGDLTLTKCFIVKRDNLFAHGETLHNAMSALQDKLFEDMPEDERIAAFMGCHGLDVKYPAQELFDWHNKLTGSCLMGREAFVKNKGLSMDATYSVQEFISLCENDYGGTIIKSLKREYERTGENV